MHIIVGRVKMKIWRVTRSRTGHGGQRGTGCAQRYLLRIGPWGTRLSVNVSFSGDSVSFLGTAAGY